MLSWELVWSGKPAKPCWAGSRSELVNQLNHVELGPGLYRSTSYQLFQNLINRLFFLTGIMSVLHFTRAVTRTLIMWPGLPSHTETCGGHEVNAIYMQSSVPTQQPSATVTAETRERAWKSEQTKLRSHAVCSDKAPRSESFHRNRQTSGPPPGTIWPPHCRRQDGVWKHRGVPTERFFLPPWWFSSVVTRSPLRLHLLLNAKPFPSLLFTAKAWLVN